MKRTVSIPHLVFGIIFSGIALLWVIGHATDAEINAYWVGWSWRLGSVNASDWSCGPLAKQWKGRACGR